MQGQKWGTLTLILIGVYEEERFKKKERVRQEARSGTIYHKEASVSDAMQYMQSLSGTVPEQCFPEAENPGL